jgi:hypothetical protein
MGISGMKGREGAKGGREMGENEKRVPEKDDERRKGKPPVWVKGESESDTDFKIRISWCERTLNKKIRHVGMVCFLRG